MESDDQCLVDGSNTSDGDSDGDIGGDGDDGDGYYDTDCLEVFLRKLVSASMAPTCAALTLISAPQSIQLTHCRYQHSNIIPHHSILSPSWQPPRKHQHRHHHRLS